MELSKAQIEQLNSLINFGIDNGFLTGISSEDQITDEMCHTEFILRLRELLSEALDMMDTQVARPDRRDTSGQILLSKAYNVLVTLTIETKRKKEQ